MINNPTTDSDRIFIWLNECKYHQWDFFVSKQMNVVRQAYAESKEAGDSEVENLIAMAAVRDRFESAK